jgi:hypothetical protein
MKLWIFGLFWPPSKFYYTMRIFNATYLLIGFFIHFFSISSRIMVTMRMYEL